MTYRTPTPPNLIPPVITAEPRLTPDVFGTLFAEVITPDGHPSVPELHGWELRIWPVARLGDATLEARPLYAHLTTGHLRDDLHHAGVQILGPIRKK